MTDEFLSLYTTSFDNILGKALGSYAAEGWELVGFPTFVKMDEAFGWNPYAIGLQPHFLVLLRRSVSSPSQDREAL